jgi:hypothetical protein
MHFFKLYPSTQIQVKQVKANINNNDYFLSKSLYLIIFPLSIDTKIRKLLGSRGMGLKRPLHP